MAADPYRPVWREGRKFHTGDRSLWAEHTRPLHDDRPLWKRLASMVSVFTESREIRGAKGTYDVAIGIKFTFFF